MYITFSLHISALYLFSLLAHAIPIKLLEDLRGVAHQKRSSYSIVDIDGSSPPPLSAATTSIFRTITRTIEDTKTLTVLPSTLATSKEFITLARTVTEPAAPIPVVPVSVVISISTLRVTTTELKTPISTVTQRVSETIRPSAAYDEVNSAKETPDCPEKLSIAQFPTLIIAGNTETAIATPTQQSPSSRPSDTYYQSIIPTSTIYSSQPSKNNAGFGSQSWSNSYPFRNNTSSTTSISYDAAVSTGTAAFLSEIRQP